MAGPIDNRGPNTVLRTLRSLLRPGVDVRIQVAFVTRSGVMALLSSLHRAARLGSVRLVTGLYEGFTEPEALRLLAAAERQSRGRLAVRISREPRFHRKLYLVTSRAQGHCIVGSSNLTTEGLTARDELNLLLTMPPAVQPFAGLARRFDEDWRLECVPVTAELVRKYAAARPSQRRPTIAPAKLRAILGSPRRGPEVSSAAENQPKLWRQSIEGLADKATQDLIREETSWGNLDWFSNPSPGIRRDDLVVLFDFTWRSKSVQLVRVRDTTTVRVRTPDGRHFVAHSPVRGTPRRVLGKRLWKKLNGLGVARSRRDAEAGRRLSMTKIEELKRTLRAG
jgi:HKD family nuclease